MIADTDAVLLALRCMFSERPHTQDLGAESLARLLWIRGPTGPRKSAPFLPGFSPGAMNSRGTMKGAR